MPPWLFYDEQGSQLFERITELPEYYPTRTERALLECHDDEIVYFNSYGTIAELGAGTAAKTGILLRAAVELYPALLYQPIDISPTALDEACASLRAAIPELRVEPQVANYTTEPIRIARVEDRAVLALYIGSSIGNFSPAEARAILRNLRRQLRPGDALLLGTDLAPSLTKSVATLTAAYDDAQGVTAAFNKNVLTRLNRELDADFALDCFRHEARWNAADSRIEMHLVAASPQVVTIPANSAGAARTIRFGQGESIHTENSHKFTRASVAALLADSGFAATLTFEDPERRYALSLALAV